MKILKINIAIRFFSYNNPDYLLPSTTLEDLDRLRGEKFV